MPMSGQQVPVKEAHHKSTCNMSRTPPDQQRVSHAWVQSDVLFAARLTECWNYMDGDNRQLTQHNTPPPQPVFQQIDGGTSVERLDLVRERRAIPHNSLSNYFAPSDDT